jgi:hypothetical protein
VGFHLPASSLEESSYLFASYCQNRPLSSLGSEHIAIRTCGGDVRKASSHDEPRKLTHYTNPFFRLVPSSTQGFGLPCNWNISEFRPVVFRCSFHQSHTDPELNLVVGQTLEAEHHWPNLHHFRDPPHLLGSNCCMG